MTDDELFKQVSEQLTDAAKILERRIDLIKSRAQDYKGDADAGKNAVAVFLVRSLTLYVRTLRYLAKQVVSEDNDDHYFSLSHVRTFADIHARLIHLLELNNDTEQAKTCITYMLYTVAGSGEDGYRETVSFYKKYLSTIGLEPPATAGLCDWKWYSNSGLCFKKNSQILTEELIKKYAVDTNDVFGAKQAYTIYSHLSGILHGNPFYHDKPYNERFWLSSIATSTSAFVIELIDRRFLDWERPRDFRQWLNGLKKFKEIFISKWPRKV